MMIEGDYASFEEEQFGDDRSDIASIDEARSGVVDEMVRSYFDSLVLEGVPDCLMAVMGALR